MEDSRHLIQRARYSKKDFSRGIMRLYFGYDEPFFEIRQGLIFDVNCFRNGAEAVRMQVHQRASIYRWAEWQKPFIEEVSYNQIFMISNIGLVEKPYYKRWEILEPKNN